MKISQMISSLAALACTALPLQAQCGSPTIATTSSSNSSSNSSSSSSKESTSEDYRYPFWVASVSGGNICVRLAHITSVTLHDYLLNGKIPISELTIDTMGNNTIRIYCNNNNVTDKITGKMPNATSLVEGKMDATGINNKVAKQFPEGTHAHSVEYTVRNTAELRKLYSSLMEALTKNKGTKYTVK